MNTIVLTRGQFVEYLKTVKGCQFASVEYHNAVRMNKKGNPYFGRVTKDTYGVVQFNYSYESAVNNRLEKQGGERTFNAEGLPFGHWVEGLENKVVEHKDNLYLRLYLVKGNPLTNEYKLDGQPMSVEDLAVAKEFFPKSSTSTKQANEGLVENQVKPFVVGLNGVDTFTINNTRIRLVDDTTETESEGAEVSVEIKISVR